MILTNKGRIELAKAKMGAILDFEYIAIGDGSFDGDLTTKDSLSNLLYTLDILKVSREQSKVIVECDMTNLELTEGFYFREIGLYANGILYSYDNAGVDAEYVEKADSAILLERRIRLVLDVSGVANIVIKTVSTMYATQKDFDSHIGNKSNPHETTKAQLGLGEVDDTADMDKPTSDPQKKYLVEKYLPLKGGTVTDSIKFKPFSRVNNPLDFKEGNIDGDGLLITAGGTTIIGSGEFPQNLFETGIDEVLPTKENLILGSDQSTYILSAGQNIKNYTGVVLDTSGNIKPVIVDGTIKPVNLGTSSAKFKNVYADNIKGSVLATNVVQDATHKFMTDAEKTKLAGMATGANAYVHPSNHPATMIIEDENHRFVTDTNKTEWNKKVDSTKVESMINDALLNKIYPIGCVYTSTVYTSPNTLFGGTWEQITDCFLAAIGTSVNAGKNAGKRSITLTTANLPSHAHSMAHKHAIPEIKTYSGGEHIHNLKFQSDNSVGGNMRRIVNNGSAGVLQANDKDGAHVHTIPGSETDNPTASYTGSVGSSQAIDITPPYYGVYAWKRIS